MTQIELILGREILDSRGNPTVDVPLFPAAPRRASAKPSSCATATKAVTPEKVC
jgi:enolase